MPPRSWMLSDLTMREVKKGRFEVALFPIGSTEPHGPHVPYGSDFLNVTATAELAGKLATEGGAKVLVFPTLNYGVNVNSQNLSLAMNIYPETMIRVVSDIFERIVAFGIRKIVILNGHGGNTDVLRAALRHLFPKLDAFISIADTWSMTEERRRELFADTATGGHACAFETSLGLDSMPDLIRLDRAHKTRPAKCDVPALRKYPILHVLPWETYADDGFLGDPTTATAEKGREIRRLSAERLAEYLVQLSRAKYTGRSFPYRR